MSLNQHFIDFEILETGNPKTLVFMDSSDYMEEPESPMLEIIPPGYTKYFLVDVEAKRLNTFNSSTIGFNQVFDQSCLINLPDGIWNIKYKICPYTVTFKCKRHMKVSQLNQKISQLNDKINLADCDVKDDAQLEKDLARIYVLVKGSQSVVNADPTKAQEYYRLADRMVQKLLDKFCKHCK